MLFRSLKEQDVDLVIPEEERQNYPDNVTARDILTQATIAQEIRSADERARSYPQQVDNSTREIAYEGLLRNSFFDRFEHVSSCFVVNQDLSPYGVFGKVLEEGSPLEAFDARCDQQPIRLVNEEELEKIRKEVVRDQDRFPATVPLAPKGVGSQMELSVQKELEVLSEKELELETEFNVYQGYGYHPRKETKEIEYLSVEGVLSMVDYRKPYKKIFESSQLKVSKNFAYTQEDLYPVFSKLQKQGYQVLVEKDSGGRQKVTLISSAEGARIKEKIRTRSIEDTWLLLPDGSPIIESNNPPPKDLEGLLLDINIFNGNIQYLLEHKEGVLEKLQGDPEKKELMFRFLKLKSMQNPVQKGSLERLEKLLSN